MEAKCFKNKIFSFEMYRWWFGTIAIMSDDQLFIRFMLEGCFFFLKEHTNTINYNSLPCKELR